MAPDQKRGSPSSKDDDPNASAVEFGRKKQKRSTSPTFEGGDVLVTFIIGDAETTTFMIHKEVVCNASPIFNAAFNGDFVEGQTQTYRLTDTTPRTFKLLMQYMYRGKLTLITKLDEDLSKPLPEGYHDKAWEEDTALVELWVLADKLMVPKACNVSLIALVDAGKVEKLCATHYCLYVYKNTTPESPLRRYVMESVLHELGADSITSEDKSIPKEMALEMAKFATRRVVENGERKLWIGKHEASKYKSFMLDEGGEQ